MGYGHFDRQQNHPGLYFPIAANAVFDTANVYSSGKSEEILRHGLKDFANRDEVVIATEANREVQPFVDRMQTARARLQDDGAKFPEISLATRAAIQRALTGQASVEAALKHAAAKIKPLLPK